MLAILEFPDLTSLRVGIPTEMGFQPLKLEILQRRTSLGPRRFERAIQTLRVAGIISVSEQYKLKTKDGYYIYFPAVRCINKAVFAALGLGERLADEMKEASARLRKKAQELGINLSQMVTFSLQAAALRYLAWRRQKLMKAQKKKGVTPNDIYNFLRKYLPESEALAHAKRLNLPTPGAPPG